MHHQRLTFEDIMQADILYYDKNAEAACFDICNYLQIDNLPAIDGSHFYELVDGEFQKKEILDIHKVSTNGNLFTPEIIEQFKANRHNVLFVFEENVIKGVVHISDYNRDIVLQSIQDDILLFERKLRQLILLNDFTNADMRKFFESRKERTNKEKEIGFYERKIKVYDNRIEEINSLGPFQLFEFSDIMDFTCSSFSKIVHSIGKYPVHQKLKSGKNILTELRNLAMHGKNPITINKETSIYSTKSLEMLHLSLNVLRKEFAALSNKIRQHPDLLKSIELDNRNKLDIIHNHHPKALEYFLAH